MDYRSALEGYWPILVFGLWIVYKFWNSRKVTLMLPELRERGATFIDVRSEGEFAQGKAPGTINIPLQQLANRLSEIPKHLPVVVCCASGTRSGMAKMLLMKNGYNDVHNIGTWGKLL